MSGIVNANHLLGFSVGTDIALMPLKSVTERQTAVMELTVRGGKVMLKDQCTCANQEI